MSKRAHLFLCLRQGSPLALSWGDDRSHLLHEDTIRQDPRLQYTTKKPKAIIWLSPHWLTAVPTTLKASASDSAQYYAVESVVPYDDPQDLVLWARKRAEGLMLYVAMAKPLQAALQTLSTYVDIQALYLEPYLFDEANTLYLYPNPQGVISIIVPSGALYLSNHQLLPVILPRILSQHHCERITWIGEHTSLSTTVPTNVQTHLTLPSQSSPSPFKNEWPRLQKMLSLRGQTTDQPSAVLPSWRMSWPQLKSPLKKIAFSFLSLLALLSLLQDLWLRHQQHALQAATDTLRTSLIPHSHDSLQHWLSTWAHKRITQGLTCRSDALPMMTIASYARILAQLPPPDTISYDGATLSCQWHHFMPSSSMDKMKRIMHAYGYDMTTRIDLRGLRARFSDTLIPITTTHTGSGAPS